MQIPPESPCMYMRYSTHLNNILPTDYTRMRIIVHRAQVNKNHLVVLIMSCKCDPIDTEAVYLLTCSTAHCKRCHYLKIQLQFFTFMGPCIVNQCQ